MANRLARATSPYLLQHMDNPVDWWEWGPEAFEEARRRGVPILLSVGYAACHWCHVMAHESFQDAATASLMNARFVNVKVDREERPDVDAVYMAATEALTGRGGWPMTAFLSHDGRPFFAGTYFPPVPRSGMPAFTAVLDAVAQAWQERRGEVEAAGRRIATALAAAGRGSGTRVVGGEREQPVAPTEGLLARAVRALARDEDRVHGGFGGAPKFPPAMDVEFLLRHAARARLAAGPRGGGPGDPERVRPPGRGAAQSPTEAASAAGDPSSGTGRIAAELAGRTLQAMARSGMYDQLAGGFARYAVDRAWAVPHFEKMLSDNALLTLVYLHWWRLTGEPTGARIAEETCDWMLAALGTPEGGLASSLDADTGVQDADGTVHGVEGLTYVWTPAELTRALVVASARDRPRRGAGTDPVDAEDEAAEDGAGAVEAGTDEAGVDEAAEDDAAWAVELLRVTPQGTFEGGTSTLQLARDVWADPVEAARWRRIRAALAEARSSRPQPDRDDKVVAAWNGLAIAALAETGALRDRPELVAAAEAVADLLLTVHAEPSPGSGGGEAGPLRLRRVSRHGVVGRPWAVLEDYGDVAYGLLVLHGVSGRARWLQAAGALLETVLTHFASPDGTLSDTGDFAADPTLAAVSGPLVPADGAYPSGTSAAATALLGYAAATGSPRHRDAAQAALRTAFALGGDAPRAFGWALATAEAILDGPREVALVQPPGADSGEAGRPSPLHRLVLAGTAPGMVVSAGEPDATGLPLLAGRTVVGGVATAYVCRGFVCDAPTTSPERLAALVGARYPAEGSAGAAGVTAQADDEE